MRPSPDDVAAFEAGLVAAEREHQLTIYPGVGHAFVQSIEAIRTDPTQGAAWEEFTTWLRRVTSGASDAGRLDSHESSGAHGQPA
jgi:dienelactone hydrolase